MTSLLLPLLALSLAAAPAVPPRARPARQAPVLVAIVVDQLAAWVAAERLPLLPSGGFARLRREGTWVKDLDYLSAATETAPGHAALFTGRTPRENGIVANAVWRADLDGGRVGSLLEAPGTSLVGAARAARGVSLERLTARPLADALRERFPGAVTVALSFKDRGAVFAAGSHPTAALWYDGEGALVTSSAFAAGLPAWAARHLQAPAPGLALTWTPLDEPFLEGHAATPDDQPGESEEAPGGRRFPHPVSGAPRPSAAFRSSPFADVALVDLALDALDATRRPDQPMLLAISFSANDHVGHLYGPDSWEAWDELLRLDATLGRLLDGLDARLGPGAWAVVLSGDHGVAPLPEVVAAGRAPWCRAEEANPYQKPCAAGPRLAGGLQERLEAAAAAELGPGGPWIARVVESLVELTPAGRALGPERRAALERALARQAAATPGLLTTVSLAPMAGACPPQADLGLAALVCRATVAGRGDLYLVPGRGSFFGGASGANHGSPYRYDRTVPLLVRYPGGARGRVVERGIFGSFYASAWYALTGEAVDGPYGGVVGRE
jgi:hypothetical protein